MPEMQCLLECFQVVERKLTRAYCKLTTCIARYIIGGSETDHKGLLKNIQSIHERLILIVYQKSERFRKLTCTSDIQSSCFNVLSCTFYLLYLLEHANDFIAGL